MEYEQIVRERRSIRGHTKDPIPKELIEEIISVAKRVGAENPVASPDLGFDDVDGRAERDPRAPNETAESTV